MDVEGLRTLERQVLEESDLSLPWRYFFEHFAADESFIGRGATPSGHEALLTRVVERVGRTLIPPAPRLEHLLLIDVAEYPVTHGAGLLGGSMMNLLFFPEIERGTLAFSMSSPGREMLFVRFSTLRVPDSARLRAVSVGGAA